MGYCMVQTNGDFEIPADKVEAAMEAIRATAKDDSLMGGGEYRGGQKVAAWYSWVDMKYAEANTISEMFRCWRYDAEVEHDTGAIIGLDFIGEKAGDEDVLFRAIAPFVRADSFIEFRGEDGERWRYTFDGEQCKVLVAKVVWG